MAVACFVLSFTLQTKRSNECPWRRMPLPSRHLYKCKQVDCSVIVVCLFVLSGFFILHFIVVCLLFNYFFILIFLLHFCLFVVYIIIVFGAFVYHLKNTISIFVTILLLTFKSKQLVGIVLHLFFGLVLH